MPPSDFNCLLAIKTMTQGFDPDIYRECERKGARERERERGREGERERERES